MFFCLYQPVQLKHSVGRCFKDGQNFMYHRGLGYVEYERIYRDNVRLSKKESKCKYFKCCEMYLFIS